MDSLAAFRSRSEALLFYSWLKKRGIACTTVNTPMSLKIGCGISVVFPGALSDVVLSHIKETRYTSFVGIYRR